MLYGGNYALTRLNFGNAKNKKLLFAIKKTKTLFRFVSICPLLEFVLCSPDISRIDGVFYRALPLS